jgi:hypothetical protein
VSPTVETLEELIFLLGEDLVLGAEIRDAGVDMDALHERLRLTPGERMQRGVEEAKRIIENSQSTRN